MQVAVVGAGRVGTAIAVRLRSSRHTIVAVGGREATADRAGTFLPGVPVTTLEEAAAAAEVVFVTVPDDAVASVISAFAHACRPGTWVVHCSGALALDVLDPAAHVGCRRLAIHPLQTFPDVRRAIDDLPGSTAAVTADDDEGFALGGRLAEDLGARPFRLAEGARPLYHAAAVLASNDLVALAGLAARAFELAGVPDPVAAMHPLQRATVDNVGRLGPVDALTGPVVRGDAGTLARNLESLAEHLPDAVSVYVVLARAAVELAVTGGRLAPERRVAIEEVLARWS